MFELRGAHSYSSYYIFNSFFNASLLLFWTEQGGGSQSNLFKIISVMIYIYIK